jgi:hypothetical protein
VNSYFRPFLILPTPLGVAGRMTEWLRQAKSDRTKDRLNGGHSRTVPRRQRTSRKVDVA